MGAELFTLFGRIATNARQVVDDLGRVDKAAMATGASMSLGFAKANSAVQQNAGAIRAAGMAFTAVGVAVGAALAGMAKAASDLEVPMRNVDSILKLSRAELEGLSQEVIALSTRLPQTAATLASGLYDIASSGFSGSDGLKVLEASAMAASAGLSDTATAARAIAGAINAYSLSANDAITVSDALFKTVERGVITFGELATGIGQVLASAATVGVTINEVGAAIATMTKAGFTADLTMTALNRILVAMLNPSKDLAAAIARVSDETALEIIEARGLIGAVEVLNEAAGGNSALLAQMGLDMRALRAAMSLTRQEGAVFRQELEYQANAAGATASALERQALSFAFQWQLMKNQMMAAAITIGNEILPALKPLVEELGKLAKGVAAFAREHPSAIRALTALAAGFAALMVAVGPLLIALPSIMSILAAIASAGGIAAVGAAFTAALPVVLAVVAAIAALGGGLYLLTKHMGDAERATEDLTPATRELSEKQAAALKVIDEVGKKTHRSVEEHEAYYKAIQDLADIYPEYVQGYDDEGDAIVRLLPLLEKARKAHEDYLIVKEREANFDRLRTVADLVEARQAVSEQRDIIADLEEEKKNLGVGRWAGYAGSKQAAADEAFYKRQIADANRELRNRLDLVSDLEAAEKARRAAAAAAAKVPPDGDGDGDGKETTNRLKELAKRIKELRQELSEMPAETNAWRKVNDELNEALKEQAFLLSTVAAAQEPFLSFYDRALVAMGRTRVQQNLHLWRQEQEGLNAELQGTLGLLTMLGPLAQRLVPMLLRLRAKVGYESIEVPPTEIGTESLDEAQLRLWRAMDRALSLYGPDSAQFEAARQAYADFVEELKDKAKEGAPEVAEIWEHAARRIHDGFASAFEGLITGASSLKGFFADLFSAIERAFAQLIAKMVADWLFGIEQMQQTGTVGGVLGNLFNWLMPTGAPAAGDQLAGAGAAQSAVATEVPKGAAGLIATKPTLALIGEGGQSEAVVPLGATGLGGGVTVVVQAIDTQTGIDWLLKNKAAVAAAMSSALAGNAPVGRRSR